jgi:hypothetical protein
MSLPIAAAHVVAGQYLASCGDEPYGDHCRRTSQSAYFLTPIQLLIALRERKTVKDLLANAKSLILFRRCH